MNRAGRQVRGRVALGLAMLLAAGGCGGKREALPDRAELVSENTGKAGFVATDDGTLLIYDRNAGKIIHSQPVRFRDKVIFYPERNEIYYNGQVVKQTPLNADHVFGLYFLKRI